jgi:hypothetical protein
METLIIHTETDKIKAIAKLLKAFNVSFEIKKTKEKPYDPEFVKMVLEARKGKRIRINPENVWESIT